MDRRTEHAWYNPLLTRMPVRLFEICDLSITPSWIVSRCQSILTEEWRQRIPLFQQTSPADLAAGIILQIVEQLDTISLSNAPVYKVKQNQDNKSYDNVIAPAATATSSTNISIIDFCSGAGGPTPTIERIINSKRMRDEETPIPFILSDLRPHLDAWKQASLESEHVSYIAEPVDAADPPTAAVSSHWSPPLDADDDVEDGEDDAAMIAEFKIKTSRQKKKTRIFRLFALSFHHFNDAQASAVLLSTLSTSHAFCILELQDRRLASLLLTVAQFAIVLLSSGLWFWRDWFSAAGLMKMACTYIWPLVPFVMAFDGVVSALRTREFEEVVRLIDASAGLDGKVGATRKAGWTVSLMQSKQEAIVSSSDGVIWRLQAGRRIHTWPIGYANWITGVRFRS